MTTRKKSRATAHNSALSEEDGQKPAKKTRKNIKLSPDHKIHQNKIDTNYENIEAKMTSNMGSDAENIDNELEEQFDEIAESGDAVIDSESEPESEQNGDEDNNSEHSEQWSWSGELKQLKFTANVGLKCFVPSDKWHTEAYDIFQLLFDDDFYSFIIRETNECGKNSKKNNAWKELSVAEFKIFLGLLLHMGTIRCPQVQNYWSTHRLFNFSCFSQHMGRNRFQDILRCLNCSPRHEDTINNKNSLDKIGPIIDYFNNKMKQIYDPEKELAIAETLIPWSGKLSFEHRPQKSINKSGVKLYHLIDSSSVTLQIKIHIKDVIIEQNDVSKKTNKTEKAVILQLLKDIFFKGHSVYVNDGITNFDLVKKLLNVDTYCTGILQKCRRGNNMNVVNAKLAKGEIICQYKNHILMAKYQDKDILFISSEFKGDLVDTKNKKYDMKLNKNTKPLALHKYSTLMSSIEKKEQMLFHSTCLRSTFDWDIKVWINIVETLLLNSYFLYTKYVIADENKMNYFDFRLNIIDALLFGTRLNKNKNNPNVTTNLSQIDHQPEVLSRDEHNRVKRKRCRECFTNGMRKNTNYYCSGCEEQPGLCLGQCFKEYHKRLL